MKSMGIYLGGYIVLVAGVLAALFKLGVLARIGTAWSLIALVMLVGLGIMISVSRGGANEDISIGRR